MFNKSTVVNGKQLTYSLISRRSRFRAGFFHIYLTTRTRFNMRGIDDSGNVANFVETEQIVEIPSANTVTSFCQTRGSIPVYWRQIPCVKYTPKLRVYPNPSTADSFRKHFTEQIHMYGNQIVIHLANKHGYESPLADAFAKHIVQLDDTRVRYIHFDFHKECSGMRWDRIELALVPMIQTDMVKMGYCHVDEGDRLVRVQSSMIRYIKHQFMRAGVTAWIVLIGQMSSNPSWLE